MSRSNDQRSPFGAHTLHPTLRPHAPNSRNKGEKNPIPHAFPIDCTCSFQPSAHTPPFLSLSMTLHRSCRPFFFVTPPPLLPYCIVVVAARVSCHATSLSRTPVSCVVTPLFGEEEYGARGREGYRGEIGLEVDQTIRGRGRGGCHGGPGKKGVARHL
jgi:hypothetical protein